jgi:lipopolysaccharide biosynthesis protein
MGGREGGFPDAWRSQLGPQAGTSAGIAVLVHVFYVELVDEIVDQLSTIKIPLVLIFTNARPYGIQIDRERLPLLAGVRVLTVDNHGRDIWPLLQVVNAGILDPYQLVLKVHTKRSDWRATHDQLGGSGRAWREGLLKGLLGDAENVRRILDAFATRPNIGLITADGSVLGPEFWGDNQDLTRSLLRRLELDLRESSLTFAAGSMYWVRGFVLQGLRALNMTAADFEAEAGQVNATTAHAVERLIGIVTREAGLLVGEPSGLTGPSNLAGGWKRFAPGALLRPRIRVVPFYLPQFHPIPENDAWWGRGFTEWTNVSAARPVYLGQHQPKLPTVTGFYDLRLDQTVALQASLAEAAGVSGFMYYHYWFAGLQLLDGPIRNRVSGDLPLPFCLMWANENWTRRWDGRESDILAGQQYLEVSSRQFLVDVMPILRDPRYMRIGGRAIVAIYRPGQIPDLPAVIDGWREVAREGGVGELFVLNVDVVKDFHGLSGDLSTIGIDGTLGFPPHNARWEWISHEQVGAEPEFAGNVLSYEALVDDAIRKLEGGVPDTYFPGVMVAFDNTARRKRDPDIWYGSNPYTFRRWLAAAAAAVAPREFTRRLVFVNAWNEWAEGAVLEPSDRYGSTYLLAVRDVTYG